MLSKDAIIYYEARWLGEGCKQDTIVRGFEPGLVEDELLSITQEQSGILEIYEICSAKTNYTMKLHKKVLVLSEIELVN